MVLELKDKADIPTEQVRGLGIVVASWIAEVIERLVITDIQADLPQVTDGY